MSSLTQTPEEKKNETSRSAQTSISPVGIPSSKSRETKTSSDGRFFSDEAKQPTTAKGACRTERNGNAWIAARLAGGLCVSIEILLYPNWDTG